MNSPVERSIKLVNEVIPRYHEDRVGLGHIKRGGGGNCFDRMDLGCGLLRLAGYNGVILPAISEDSPHGAIFLPKEGILLDSDSTDRSFIAEQINPNTSSSDFVVAALTGLGAIINDWHFMRFLDESYVNRRVNTLKLRLEELSIVSLG